MYIIHLKKELCTTFKGSINDISQTVTCKSNLFTVTNHLLLLIGVRNQCAIEIAKSAQKISSLIAKGAQMQGAKKLLPIRHIFRTNFSHFVKNTHEDKIHIAYMRIPQIDKIPPNLLHFAFHSNSSQFRYWHLWRLSRVKSGGKPGHTFAISGNPDETAHYEPSHLAFHFLLS